MPTLGAAAVLADLEVHVISLPMAVPFRGTTVREAVLLRGPAGWGEFAPFPEYADAEAVRWLGAALSSARDPWPASVRDRVPVNATVPAVPAEAVASVLQRFSGCTTAKVKVAESGQSLRDDGDRVAATREALGATGRVRVDANGGWSLDDAVRAIRALAPYGLEYVEQPCAALADLSALRIRLARAGLDVLVAADESIRKATDPLRVAVAGAADVVVLKVAPLGGVRAALEVAENCGLPIVVSSALDTSVGIAAGVAMAASLPDLPYACGLATVNLMSADVVHSSLNGLGGWINTGRVEPDDDLLRVHAAAPARQLWWRTRLARCAHLLGELPA